MIRVRAQYRTDLGAVITDEFELPYEDGIGEVRQIVLLRAPQDGPRQPARVVGCSAEWGG